MDKTESNCLAGKFFKESCKQLVDSKFFLNDIEIFLGQIAILTLKDDFKEKDLKSAFSEAIDIARYFSKEVDVITKFTFKKTSVVVNYSSSVDTLYELWIDRFRIDTCPTYVSDIVSTVRGEMAIASGEN